MEVTASDDSTSNYKQQKATLAGLRGQRVEENQHYTAKNPETFPNRPLNYSLPGIPFALPNYPQHLSTAPQQRLCDHPFPVLLSVNLSNRVQFHLFFRQELTHNLAMKSHSVWPTAGSWLVSLCTAAWLSMDYKGLSSRTSVVYNRQVHQQCCYSQP